MDNAQTHVKGPGEMKTQTMILLGALSLLLYLSGFLVWLTPLPLLYAYKKGGRNAGLWSIGVAVICLFLLYFGVLPLLGSNLEGSKALASFFWVPGMGPEEAPGLTPSVYGISYYAFYGLIGVLLGETERRATDITQLIGKTLGFLMLGLVIWLFWQVKGNWGGMVSGLEQYFIYMIAEITKVPGANPDVQNQLALLSQHKETIAHYAVRLLPAMIINSAIFIIWLNIVVARKLFFRETMFIKLGSLRVWHVPFIIVWAVIGIAGLLFADVYLIHTNLLKIFSINALIVFSLVYFFQGLSIVAFYSQRWSLSPLVRIIFYFIFLLFFQPLAVLMLAFGFFDSWFDFRKLTPKEAR